MAPLAFGPVSELPEEFALSVYGAVYLELAMRRRLPLACKDGPLLDAARRARVAIWRARESG
jgi:predicted nucleic acid-binding protein